MGLPALRGDRQFTTALDVDGRTQADSEPAAAAPNDVYDLTTIVESVFDPSSDCVIYESAIVPQTNGIDHGSLYVPGGASLATAATCGEALERLGRTRFVVAVAAPQYAELQLTAELKRLTGLSQRCIIVAPANGGELAVQTELADGGWDVADLRGKSTAHAIAKELVTARYDQKSKLVLIEAAVLSMPQTVAHPAVERHGAAAQRIESVEAAVAGELRRRMPLDVRLTPVILTDDPVWTSLERPGGKRATDGVGLERGLLTAAALAQAGCHPVIVVGREGLSHPPAAAWILGGRKFAGTLIVLQDGSGNDAVGVWPQEFDVRVLPADVGPEEAVAALAECLAAPRVTLLSLPAGGMLPNALRVPTDSEPSGTVTEATIRIADRAGAFESPQGLSFAVSAESAHLDQEEIQRKRLRLEVLRWVQDYDRVGQRNLYLWRWCLHGIELTTFPDVAERYRAHLHDTKLLSVILCVLFDDVADRHGRAELLETLIQSAADRGREPIVAVEGDETEYVEVTRRLWTEYESRARQYPQYAVFERLWRFDLLQFLNTMRYAHLVNSQPGLLNLTEHDIYTPHNMLMVSFSTLDLMSVAHFQTGELGHLREAMWHAQAMGRIGNVLSTWRRELSEADHSSGMFVGDPSLSMSTREHLLLEKWRWHRTRCHAAAAQVRSLDLIPVLRGHDRFFDMHLASAGRI